MRTRHYILSLILLFQVNGVLAQRYSPVTLFHLNQTYYNPAANGNQEVLAANFFYRQNWVGFPGAASTQTFSVHTPLRNPAVALGLLIEHDAYGGVNNTGLHISYAYRLSLGANKLAFGLRTGLRIQSEDINGREDNDPALEITNMPDYQPNFGFGLLYYGRQYWAGLSVPWLFDYESDTVSSAYGIHYDPRANEYCLMGGGSFSFSPNFGLEPSVFFVYYPAGTPTFAIDIMGVYKEFYKAGVGYRTGLYQAVSLLLSINLNRQFCLGYSYDVGIGITGFSAGTHEIHIQYKFGYKVNASNPRGF